MTEESENASSDELKAQNLELNSIPSVGRLAGIDYGTVRIGVAVSDPSQVIASPHEVYQRRNEKLDQKYFVDLAKSEPLVGFVVGLPIHTSGDPSQKSKEAIQFGKWLSDACQLPVVWIDERFSTAQARELLNQSNLSGKKRKAQLDKIAAQVLLSCFLDNRENSLDGRDLSLEDRSN